MKKVNLILLFHITPIFAFSQIMDITTYRDTTLSYIELDPTFYNFSYPINSDIFSLPSFNPPSDGVYLEASYGHRYLSNTSTKTDNHGGYDFWSEHVYEGIVYDDNNKIAIVSMCDGIISKVVNGEDADLELTAEGRSVQVKCDTESQAFEDYIKINYRHLSSLGSLAAIAENAVPNSILISKGDTIGIMGDIGTTTNIHLHLSTEMNHPVNGNSFLHPSRLFNPLLYPNVLSPLADASVEILQNWEDSALFRISWPFNQTINRFEFINEQFNVVFDKEQAYDVGSGTRNNHDAISGIRVYAYQFNGKQTALSRYNSEKVNMPAIYPASPQRDANLMIYNFTHYPITQNNVAYVYDFVIHNLPPGYIKNDFKVKLSDVWGYTVEASFPVSLPIELLSFDIFLKSEQTVSINWSTASEINNDFFTIERSIDSHKWEEVTILDPSENSLATINYNTLDKQPYSGLSYYRLKQTDFNGEYKYSTIKSINIKNTHQNVMICPNPTLDQFILQGDKSELRTLRVYNSFGKEVTLFINIIVIDENTIKVDLSNLTVGLYFVKTKTTTKKIYKTGG